MVYADWETKWISGCDVDGARGLGTLTDGILLNKSCIETMRPFLVTATRNVSLTLLMNTPSLFPGT